MILPSKIKRKYCPNCHQLTSHRITKSKLKRKRKNITYKCLNCDFIRTGY